MMPYQYTPSPFMLATSRYDKAKADRAVAFIESMRRETVAGQEIVVAQGCVCAREVREMLEGIAGQA